MDRRVPWLLLLPALAAACRRASRCYANLPLDRALEELAAAPPLPAALRDPATARELVDRLLPWLPPRGLRPCLKRSLLLMDLWSRCGLEPRFHLGRLPEAEVVEGHAWVSVEGAPSLTTDPEPFAGPVLWES